MAGPGRGAERVLGDKDGIVASSDDTLPGADTDAKPRFFVIFAHVVDTTTHKARAVAVYFELGAIRTRFQERGITPIQFPKT